MRKPLGVMLVCLSVPILLSAATVPPQGSFFTTLQSTFSAAILAWQTTLRPVANSLLFSLTAIQIALIGMKLVIQESLELSTILGELVRLIVTVGFLSMLINMDYTPAGGGTTLPILQQILESFIKISKNIDTSLASFTLDDLVGKIAQLVSNMRSATGFWSLLWNGVAPILIALVGVFVVTKAVTSALKNYVFALVAIQVAPIVLAAAVLEYTRPWALSVIILIIKYSMKYMALVLVIYLIFGLFSLSISNLSSSDSSLLTMVALSIIMLELVKGAEGIVEGLFSGSDHNKSNLVKNGLK